MDETTHEMTTHHRESEQRYVVEVDGELAGSAFYERRGEHGEVVDFTHTEVDDRFEGHGVGSTLARAALDDVRAQGGLRVRASCPFIASWIEKHRDYADLLETSTETR